MDKTRSTTRNQNYNVSLSNVNHDVLLLVMMRLGVVDFLAFSGVCKSWRSLALSNWNRFMASKPPMRMWISTHDCDKYFYLKDFEEKTFRTSIRHSAGRKCVGLTCGYLILFDGDFLLVNPITRRELHFPYLPFPFYVDAGIRGFLVFSPSVSGFLFVFINGFSSDEIWFSIAGKGEWNHVISDFPILDSYAFKGKIYALRVDRRFEDVGHLCEMRFDSEPKLMLLETKNFPKTNLQVSEFVSCGENLYVIQYISLRRYKCHQLDFGKMEWVSCEKTKEECELFFSRVNRLSDVRKSSWWATAHMWYFPNECLNVK